MWEVCLLCGRRAGKLFPELISYMSTKVWNISSLVRSAKNLLPKLAQDVYLAEWGSKSSSDSVFLCFIVVILLFWSVLLARFWQHGHLVCNKTAWFLQCATKKCLWQRYQKHLVTAYCVWKMRFYTITCFCSSVQHRSSMWCASTAMILSSSIRWSVAWTGPSPLLLEKATGWM